MFITFYFILFFILFIFVFPFVVYGGIPVPVADGEAATTEGAAAPPTAPAPTRAKKNAKREITMALWSLDDCYVVTALSDHSIKVPFYPIVAFF